MQQVYSDEAKSSSSSIDEAFVKYVVQVERDVVTSEEGEHHR